MPEEGELGPLKGLDSAASEARSLLRRAQRLSERLQELDELGQPRLAQAVVEATETLLMALEEARAEQRERLRRRIRGGGG